MNINDYEELAKRNGWDFYFDERPYFLKDGKYATPDETTSLEDKEMLAKIFAEGSAELENIILLCWENAFKIGGPCSGIREAHKNTPIYLHCSIIGDSERLNSLYEMIYPIYPDFVRLTPGNGGEIRFDFSYFLNGKELTKEDAEEIFSVIRQELENVLNKEKKVSK